MKLSPSADEFLKIIYRQGPADVTISGIVLRPGSRVRLKPLPGGDMLDSILAGKTAVIEGIDEDESGGLHVSVILENDPGRDLGDVRHPAHRFFFIPEELEPCNTGPETVMKKKVLVAGIGNIFFGDDAFGVEVAKSLLAREVPDWMHVVEFGIRGMDLAYSLGKPYDAAILIDCVSKGAPPGTIHLMEAEGAIRAPACQDAHCLDPVSVLEFARRLGPLPPTIILVGCEPEITDERGMCMGLSEHVSAAVQKAADLVLETARHLIEGRRPVCSGMKE